MINGNPIIDPKTHRMFWDMDWDVFRYIGPLGPL